jgi:hypothetical protein
MLGLRPMLHGEGASGASFSKNHREWSVYYINIYITFIFNKNMQKDKLAAEYMKTCIFVLVDEYYIIMKFEIPSIVY